MLENWFVYPTTKDRAEAFARFCNSHECGKCGVRDSASFIECLLIWLALDSGLRAEPCPFCGRDVVISEDGSYVECTHCIYQSPALHRDRIREVIAWHNDVASIARAARDAGKREKIEIRL